jgi:hypothetical protein
MKFCCYDRNKQGMGYSVSCTNGLYAYGFIFELGTVKTVISGHKNISLLECYVILNGKVLNDVVKECILLIFRVKQCKKNISMKSMIIVYG